MSTRFARTRPQMTLGQLIDRLEAIPNQTLHVQYDFGRMSPTPPKSYRGSYAELAIGYDDVGSGPEVATFLRDVKEAVGKTYQGYKGGDFTMDLDTPIWVALWGESGTTALVDVLAPNAWEVVLMTEYCEF